MQMLLFIFWPRFSPKYWKGLYDDTNPKTTRHISNRL